MEADFKSENFYHSNMSQEAKTDEENLLENLRHEIIVESLIDREKQFNLKFNLTKTLYRGR